ncbi:HNH endonuclease [Nocardioides sp. dk4132]|uniref:HNH endonuclease signature motif containing protein n=1 Tax=unclassified Nocardioides TaxID=2615069 RepID=UPI0012954D74|nr:MULTISPECIES: HNH endonuclease signature motif containing protein [unclassified Nocardioides]MQW74941.1 HNH endonuclease [Nocardioides sp. dk4132]QGA07873.1 HNH endonuclease [Nocardioides sp. dk884]
MASPELPDCDTPAAVLAFAQRRRAAAQRAEIDVLEAALVWAAMHPEESVADAAPATGLVFGELAVPLAGEGTPLVAEFAPMEFGAAIGMSTDSARALVGDALELAHRLKRTWKLVRAGKVPLWKARRLAQLTATLPLDGADFVDRQLADFVGKTSWAGIERLVDEARVAFDPEGAEKDRLAAADGRRFDVRTDEANRHGSVHVEGVLDLADAIDLNTAISQGAEDLAALGSTESLDVRRSMAAGELARRQLAFDLRAEAGEGAAAVVKPRQVVIHVHLSHAAISRDESGIAHVEETRSIVSTDQVRDWCSNPQTQVVIKPVIDLEAHHHTDAYAIPDRLVDQARLTQPVCAFPWCERPARRCDTDHVTAHGAGPSGGPTCSCNLAPLCRRHHRAKTHTGWTYDKTDAATYLWRSPHGLHLVKDHGTTSLLAGDPPDDP